MIDLILCIVCTGGIFLVFRYFKSYGVNTPMAIVINYAVAAGLGWSLAGGVDAMEMAVEQPWFYTTVIMGAGFLFLFNMIAYCTRELGVTVASLSAKLSLIIPSTAFMLLDPSDNLSLGKIVAFSLAIAAIVLTSMKEEKTKEVKWWLLVVPAIIFLGSGGIDFVFGIYSEASPLMFTSVPFTVAFLMGICIRVLPSQRHAIALKDVLGGVALGLINFGSLYYLLGAYENSGVDKSAVIPSLNIGVIIFSTVAAIILFHEKPSVKTKLGLALGLISISIFLFAAA